MKPLVVIIALYSSVLLMGCSHIHTISMPILGTKDNVSPPIDLSPFWKTNGFTLMDPTSEIGRIHYRSDHESRVVAVWEKWFKGVVFKYSGGMWATETLRNSRYEIIFLPVSSSRDAVTERMARTLRDYVATNWPSLYPELETKAFMDLR